MKPDYARLAEQYGSFLVAIGGVSITVLTLVLSAWRIQRQSGRIIESGGPNNRPALVKSLIIATFCSFVGAQLMAEMVALDQVGATHFLWASVNIFIAVTVVIFAVMLLATEYRRDTNIEGIGTTSRHVFYAVLFSVLAWMLYSVFFRMPAPEPRVAPLISVVGVPIFVFARYLRDKNKDKRNEALLKRTFKTIVWFTVISLLGFLCSLKSFPFSLELYRELQIERLTKDFTVIFFVWAINYTCLCLYLFARSVKDPDRACGQETPNRIPGWVFSPE